LVPGCKPREAINSSESVGSSVLVQQHFLENRSTEFDDGDTDGGDTDDEDTDDSEMNDIENVCKEGKHHTDDQLIGEDNVF